MKAIGLAIAALCASAISMGAQAVNCTGLPEWNSATAYGGSTKVQEAGKAYTAAWWSQGHSPASYSGQWQEWKLDGTCDSSNHAPVAVAKTTTSMHIAGVHPVGFSAADSTDVDGDTLTYTWNFGDPTNPTSPSWPNTATGVSVSHLYYGVGTFTATLTVTDGKGGVSTATTQAYTYCECSRSSSSVVTSSVRPSSSSVATTTSSSSSSASSVIANRAPVAKIMSTSVQLVAETVALGVSGSSSTDADGDALSYAWDFGDQTSATGVSANHMYVTAGTYTVKLTVSDGKGGVGTATTQAIVAPKPNSSSSVGNGCTSPQFVSGTSYTAGQLVQNAGNEYKCDIAGWCSSTADWAYAPGTGSYWSSAWTLVRSCGVATSSSSSVSSVITGSSSSKSSVTSSTGNARYHLISGYWHNFNNGSGVIPIDQVSSAYDFINVSFAEPTDTNGHIGFTLDPAFDKASFKAGIKAKQAAGYSVIISIGGANGHVSLLTPTARANFVSSMKAIIDEYGFNGLDVDFEGQSLYLNAGDADFRNPTTPVIVNLIGALQDLTNYYGSKFILTMAPETFFVQLGYSFYGGTCSGCDTRAGAYLPVIYAMRDKLTALQVQNYNSGSITGLDNQYHSMGGADFHVAMVDMLLTGFKVAGTNLTFPALRQDQVLLGLPANGNAGGGFTSVADVQSAVNCLAKLQGCGSYKPHTSTGWTSFRGLMTWSINWDKYNNFEFSNNHRAFLDKL